MLSPDSPPATIQHTMIIANAISDWLARTQPKPEIITERVLIARETVTREVVMIERTITKAG